MAIGTGGYQYRGCGLIGIGTQYLSTWSGLHSQLASHAHVGDWPCNSCRARVASYEVACPVPEPHRTSYKKQTRNEVNCDVRNTLQQQMLAELCDRARELHLPTTGRKSALVDRLYRVVRPRPVQQDPAPPPPPPSVPIAPPRDPRPPTSPVQCSSLQGVEEHLLQVICPLPRPTPTADNLSLLSRDKTQHRLAAAGAATPFAADG